MSKAIKSSEKIYSLQFSISDLLVVTTLLAVSCAWTKQLLQIYDFKDMTGFDLAILLTNVTWVGWLIYCMLKKRDGAGLLTLLAGAGLTILFFLPVSMYMTGLYNGSHRHTQLLVLSAMLTGSFCIGSCFSTSLYFFCRNQKAFGAFSLFNALSWFLPEILP